MWGAGGSSIGSQRRPKLPLKLGVEKESYKGYVNQMVALKDGERLTGNEGGE
jgi:hypothetical protein